jgi:hypothetical protein
MPEHATTGDKYHRRYLVAILAAWLFGSALCCCLGFGAGVLVPRPGNDGMKDVARVLLVINDWIGDCLFQFINA